MHITKTKHQLTSRIWSNAKYNNDFLCSRAQTENNPSYLWVVKNQ